MFFYIGCYCALLALAMLFNYSASVVSGNKERSDEQV